MTLSTEIREALAAVEVAELNRFYQEYPEALRARDAVEVTAKQAVERNERLLERFGNRWSFEAETTDSFVSPPMIEKIMLDTITRWERGAQLKNKTMPPLAFHDGRDAAWRLFCDTLGCHVPMPVAGASIFQARIAPETSDYAVASGVQINIRKGQAVSRVVLSYMRKHYKANPTYLAFWEALFETLGVYWAAAQKYRLVLSAAPSSFYRLGTIGENSCYRVGGEWERAKLTLPTIPGACTLMIYQDVSDTVAAPIGRAWGIIASEAAGAEFTNFYLIPQQQVLPSLCGLLQKLFNSDTWTAIGQPGRRENSIPAKLHMQVCFVNGDHIRLSPATSNQAAVSAELLANVQLLDQFKCLNCGSTANLRRCEYCNEQQCEECLREDQRAEMWACERCAEERWHRCAQCNDLVYHYEECSISHQRFCIGCSEDRLRTCDRCMRYVVAAHRTQCPDCNQRRCDECVREGESRERGTHCASCARTRRQLNNAAGGAAGQAIAPGILAAPSGLTGDTISVDIEATTLDSDTRWIDLWQYDEIDNDFEQLLDELDELDQAQAENAQQEINAADQLRALSIAWQPATNNGT